MKTFKNQKNHNLSFLVQMLYFCLASLKYCIKIRLTVQQLMCNTEQSKLKDVQKYFHELNFSVQTQYQILQETLINNQNISLTHSFAGLEHSFLAFMKKENGMEFFLTQLKTYQVYFKNQFLLQRDALVSFQPQIIEIIKNSEKQQQQQRLQNNIFEEVLESLRRNINDNFKMMECTHLDEILKIINPIKQFIKNIDFSEDYHYWLLFNKIRFQIQLYQILIGEKPLTNYTNEVFILNFKDWKNKLSDGSFFTQFRFVDMKYRDEIYNGLNCQINDQKLIKNQLETFFSKSEIINIMEQTQEKLNLTRDSSLDFLEDIKFVVNPDEKYFCESIRDFGIIINLFWMIELYQGQIVDNIEFRQNILAYITVITIQGWNQQQVLKLGNKKILTYKNKMDQKDQQFILNHLIFGQTDGESNLKAINKHIADQINNFQSTERLQSFLKQYSNEGYILEEI